MGGVEETDLQPRDSVGVMFTMPGYDPERYADFFRQYLELWAPSDEDFTQ